ncbi:MAG: signal peptidase II, partial [Treponema sp.]|nr:signal peptidase II [Treponema sp.]
MNKELKSKLLPFILTFVVLLLDQLTKSLIVHFIPPYTIGTQFFGDFLRIIHVSNSGVAFSMGADWSTNIRKIFFA